MGAGAGAGAPNDEAAGAGAGAAAGAGAVAAVGAGGAPGIPEPGIGGVHVTFSAGMLHSGLTSRAAWFMGPLITALPSFMIMPATPTADCLSLPTASSWAQSFCGSYFPNLGL